MVHHSTSYFIKHVLKIKFLRNLLLVVLFTPLVFPLFGKFYILPHFRDKLLTYVEEEAQQVAEHLLSNLIFIKHGLPVVNDQFTRNIDRVGNQFKLEKIKIFDHVGQVIYSTDNKDIGVINKHSYFHETVAKGKIFSKIVTKGAKTMEGRTIDRDVAEIYIPIMQEAKFVGAFEIYQDLTNRRLELTQMFDRFSMIGYATSTLMFGLIGLMMYRTSRAIVLQREAEHQLKNTNHNLEKLVEDKIAEIRVTEQTSIEALAILAEYHDKTTGTHLDRIRSYTRLLVQELAKDPRHQTYFCAKSHYLEDLSRAAILHDIGKTAIPDDILLKPGRYTAEEFDQMKLHTVIAGDILARGNTSFVKRFGMDSYLALARDIALHHHEKWDGTGYPGGLRGEGIPLSARIVALADVYDALRSERPYKKAWSHEEAVEEIVRDRGSHFDPVIVDAFLEVHEEFRRIAELQS